jgi:PASTA domain-containing protein
MPDDVGLVEEIIVPFEQAILTVARGVAQAQKALDQNSIEIQKSIDADPELAALGLSAPWFQMPEIELEMKLSLSIHEQTTSSRRELGLAFHNATYRNRFQYDLSGTSSLKLKIRPVPPPTSLTVPRSVPDLVGGDLISARRLATEAGLVVTDVTRRRDERPADTVLEQDPPAGSQLPAGGTIALTVSSGPTG